MSLALCVKSPRGSSTDPTQNIAEEENKQDTRVRNFYFIFSGM